ncbi:MAG: dephospho-CoA kinase [Candidatus Polarisedimenticolia bacterium]
MSVPDRKLLTAGMTGGIACGRSTLGRLFTRLGAFVIDMDELAHQLMASGGAAVKPVTEALGTAVSHPSGGIDRRALARLVFSDAAARAKLEGILHPMILDAAQRLIDDYGAKHARGIVIVDAALLVETGGWRRYQRLVVVTCDPELQLQRLMARDQLGEADARARIAAQAPLEEKVRVADYVIDTSGTLAESESRAHEVYAQLVEDLDRLPDLPSRRQG